MNAEGLLEHYARIADAPDAVARLRRFILDLAVRGKLVPQEVGDEPASELLKRIANEKARLVKAGEIKAAKGASSADSQEEFTIPAVWSWVRLADVTSYIQRGKSPKYAVSHGLPIISQKCVQWVGLDLSSAKLIEEASLASYEPVRFLQKDDLVWNSTGTGTIGRIVRLVGSYDRLICDSHVTVVRCLLVDAEYIRIWLRSDHVYGRIEARAAGSTNQVELTAQMAQNQVAPLPPLAEQHRIVAKVDELMALCDQLEAARVRLEATRDRLAVASLARLNAPDPETFAADARFALAALPPLTARPDQIKQLRQTILNLAVRGKIVPQDTADEPANFIDAAIPSNLDVPFSIPDSWRWARLHKLGMLQGGGTPSKADESFWTGNIPWVSPKDMKTEDIYRAQMSVTEEALAKSAAKLIANESILFVVRGMILAHSFPVAISRVPLAINQDMKALTPIAPEMCEYIFRALKGLKPELLKRVQRSSHGTCRLESSDYGNLLIPLPPLAEQHRIVAKVDALMTLCDRLEASLTAAAATRRRLLDALLAEALAPAADRLLEAAE